MTAPNTPILIPFGDLSRTPNRRTWFVVKRNVSRDFFCGMLEKQDGFVRFLFTPNGEHAQKWLHKAEAEGVIDLLLSFVADGLFVDEIEVETSPGPTPRVGL